MPLPVAPPDRLEAGPFVLRAMVEADWALEVALARDPDVLRWTHYRPRMTEADARERLARTSLTCAAADTYRYLITDGESNLGVAGVFADPGEVPEIYYALVPTGRRRGAASLAARALSDLVLDNGSDVVSLVIFDGNDASEAVARRAGFSLRRRASTEHQGLPTVTTVWERTARTPLGARPGAGIRLAEPADLGALPAIEVAAGELFRACGMDRVADDAPPSVGALAGYLAEGRAWVATDHDNRPVAYALVELMGDDAHVEQVSVPPDHAGKRLGAGLIDAVGDWALGQGGRGPDADDL